MKASLKTFAAAVVGAAILAPAVHGQTVSRNSGSIGSAGDGINSAGVTLNLPGPLAAPGDSAAGYFNPSAGGAGTFNTQVPFNAALNPAAAFTVEFWARPAVEVTDAPGPCPVFNRVSTSPRSGWVFFQRSPTTGWNFAMYSGSGSTIGFDLTGGSNAADTWSHVVAVWNGTSPTLYVNGVLADDTATGSGVYNASTSAILSIGTYDTGANAFNGAVDELAIYGTALSAPQIAAHYAAASSSTPGAYSSLVLGDGALEYLQNVPEPSVLALLSIALIGFVARKRRRAEAR